MRTELIDLLTAYLMGWKNLCDCSEWFASIDWNSPDVNPDIQEIVGLLELLSTEALEGLRPEAEFWQEAATYVANETNSLYSQQIFITVSNAVSSNNDTAIFPGVTIPMAERALQSWSISPLPEFV